MIKQLIILSALSVVLCQEYDFTSNLVDLEDPPYKRVSLPYPYMEDRERRVISIQRKPIKNAIVLDNGLVEVTGPANSIRVESEDFGTSFATKSTSVISTVSAVVIKLLGGLKLVLKKLILHIPALIFGAVLVIGFCKITSVCTKISSIQSLIDAKKELISFLTPERLDMASEFVQEAIRRYRSIQTK